MDTIESKTSGLLSRLPARLHHNAFVVRDHEVNRRFFEDLLGIPLVATWCEKNFSAEMQREVEFCHTFYGMADGSENVVPPASGYFYDELPLRVRTIDFSKPTAGFEIQLAPTTINSKKEAIIFKPAKISFASREKTIEVDLQHAGGKDHFVLDREFPFLLREWNAADGSHLKLKRSLKIDYWNYNKPGDRERALADPMLRHPD